MPKSYKFTQHEVLVDVDGVLLIDSEGYFNEHLIDAFLAQGIREISLFTSMSNREIIESMSDPNANNRPKLINHLESRGITVKAVITPADASLNQGLGAAYETFYVPQHVRALRDEVTKTNYPQDEAFTAARVEYDRLNEETGEKAASLGSQSEKAILFRYFCEEAKKAGASIKSILFIDDVEKHTSGVKAENNASHHLNLETIHMPKQIPATKELIKKIKDAKCAQSLNAYNQLTHFSAAYSNLLDDYQDAYNSKRFFKTQSSATAKALDTLNKVDKLESDYERAVVDRIKKDIKTTHRWTFFKGSRLEFRLFDHSRFYQTAKNNLYSYRLYRQARDEYKAAQTIHTK